MEKLSSGLKKVVWSRAHCRNPIKLRMSEDCVNFHTSKKAPILWIKCKWENITVAYICGFFVCFVLFVFEGGDILSIFSHKTKLQLFFFCLYRKKAGTERICCPRTHKKCFLFLEIILPSLFLYFTQPSNNFSLFKLCSSLPPSLNTSQSRFLDLANNI